MSSIRLVLEMGIVVLVFVPHGWPEANINICPGAVKVSCAGE